MESAGLSFSIQKNTLNMETQSIKVLNITVCTWRNFRQKILESAPDHPGKNIIQETLTMKGLFQTLTG